MQNNVKEAVESKFIIDENNRYRDLFSDLCAGILVTSHPQSRNDIRILEVNNEFTKMTGFTMEDINTRFDGLYVNLIDNRDRDELQGHIYEQLSQSEQLFRITNNASGGAVFDFDFATGAYLHFENAEHIYGVPASKIISVTKWFGTLSREKSISAMISYFYYPDDAYIVEEAFQTLTKDDAITYVARS